MRRYGNTSGQRTESRDASSFHREVRYGPPAAGRSRQVRGAWSLRRRRLGLRPRGQVRFHQPRLATPPLRFADPSRHQAGGGLPSGRLSVAQKGPGLAAGASYRGIMTPLHYFDAGADGPSGVDMLGCKGPAAGRFGRGKAATCALLFAATMRAPLVVPEERQENDDRDRYPKQPKQYASTKTHGNLHRCPLRRVNASGREKLH